MSEELKWHPNDMVEVFLKDEDAFLLIKETLTRMGIASYKTKTLFQSCHILHKKGKYYIVHFKELFLLDGRQSNLTQDDINRRNSIIKMLCDWDLCKLVQPIDQPEE